MRTCTEILCHIEFCTFEVIAHSIHHVVYAQLAVGFNPKWHTMLQIPSFCIIDIAFHLTVNGVEKRPYANFAKTSTTELNGIVRIAEAEIGILAIKIFHLARKGNHVVSVYGFYFGVEELVQLLACDGGFTICQGESANTSLVGMCTNVAIWHASRNPYNAAVSIFHLLGFLVELRGNVFTN